MSAEGQAKELDAWQASARYWDKYRALIAQIFAPLTAALVEEADTQSVVFSIPGKA